MSGSSITIKQLISKSQTAEAGTRTHKTLQWQQSNNNNQTLQSKTKQIHAIFTSDYLYLCLLYM